MIKIYGIKNCDTMKKAMKWLDDNKLDFEFHDYRKDGADKEMIGLWAKELGIERLLNKRGTTWRKIPDTVKENLDEDSTYKLMADNPAMIKRPLFDLGNTRIIGFSKEEQALLESKLLK